MTVFPDSKAAYFTREERWDDLAQRKGYKCVIDGTLIPFVERDIYFQTGVCGWCAHQMQRDD